MTSRADQARTALADIVAGKATLIDAAGNTIPRTGTGARAGGPAPVMTPENLQGL